MTYHPTCHTLRELGVEHLAEILAAEEAAA